MKNIHDFKFKVHVIQILHGNENITNLQSKEVLKQTTNNFLVENEKLTCWAINLPA